MPIEYEWFLPNVEGDVQRPDRTGAWEHKDELLAKVARNLIVGPINRGEQMSGGPVVTGDILTAIPTPWARPLLFAAALTDLPDNSQKTGRQHPLHNEVLNEWRGLLGMFCFREYFNVSIEVKRLDLNENLHTVAGKALFDLRPSDEWKTVWLIYANKQLIAGTSPLTIFFTAPEYSAPVPWIDAETGRLIDPLHYFRQPDPARWQEFLITLYNWVNHCISNVVRVTTANTQTLSRLFTEWRDEILGALNNQVPPATGFDLNPPVNIPEPCCHFTQAVSKSGSGGECSISTEKWKHNPDAPAVLTDHLWQNYPKHRLDIVHTVETVKKPAGEKGERLQTTGGITINLKWINPEVLFFTRKATRLPISDYAMGAEHVNILPPLRREVFDYFTPEELKRYLKMNSASDGGVDVQLAIPLRNGGWTFALKHYPPQDILPGPKTPPALALWPNFRAPNWKHNYCFCFSQERDWRFEPIEVKHHTARSNCDVWLTDELTEAFLCFHKEEGSEVAVGAVIPLPDKFPLLKEESTATWEVSVDFGTSNTTLAYKRSPDAEPQVLVISDRVVFLTKLEPNSLTEAKIYIKQAFMPVHHSDDWPAYRKDGIGSSICFRYSTKSDPMPVLDAGFVPLDCHPLWNDLISGSSRGGLQGEIKAGLKWSIDPDTRKLITMYLQHLLLLVCAEAKDNGVGTLKLFWSYPTALPGWMVDDLTQKWQNVTSIWGNLTYEDTTGINLEINRGVTESESVCRYSVKRHKANLDGLVTIDIGGGTSDIAIWYDEKLQLQSSILLSAGTVVSYLTEDLKVAEFLVKEIANLPQWEGYFERVWKGGDRKILVPAAVNLMLRLVGRKFLTRMGLHAHDTDSGIPLLRSLVLYTFAGIAYYVGLCLRAITQKTTTESLRGCEVYLCGNGARLLDWVGDFDSVKNHLAEILQRAAEPLKISDLHLPPPRTDRNDYLKREVALGLLYDPIVPADSGKVGSLLIGEPGYNTDGFTAEWNLDLNSKDGRNFLKGQIEVPSNFPELGEFLRRYDAAAEQLNLQRLSDRVKPGVVGNRVATRLHELRQSLKVGNQELPLSSLFVEEVIAVIDEYLLKREPE